VSSQVSPKIEAIRAKYLVKRKAEQDPIKNGLKVMATPPRLQPADPAKLDLFSADFDAAEAIFNPNFALPDPNAPSSDNVEIFVSKYESRNLRDSQRSKSAKDPEPDEIRKVEASGSRFEGILKNPSSDAMANAAPAKPQREPPNVLRNMQKIKSKGGPMSLLSKCVEENKRIKVMVRGVDRVRGHVTGFLVAFDKHWNMALTDVEETFHRRKKVKSPPIAEAEIVTEKMQDMKLKSRRSPRKSSGQGRQVDRTKTREVMGFSTVHVIERKRKTEVCKRHIPQVVLRGEHVVCVLPMSS